MSESTDEKKQQQQQQQHASTYTPGEDQNRLASAAQYFGIRNTRAPLRPIREQNQQIESEIMTTVANSDSNQHPTPTQQDAQSILKFGSTVWNNVGLIFSDSTLEAARMHSVGVTAREERVAGDGTLHLRSIVRRMKKKKRPAVALGDMFKPLLEEGKAEEVEKGEEEPLEIEDEVEEYEEVEVEVVEGGSITAAIFGIIKGMVGPAVLYLPRGFAISGYGVAIPAMFLATASYLYCATRLLQCWKVESTKSMERIEKIKLLLDPETPVVGKTKTNYGSLLEADGDRKVDINPSIPQLEGRLLTYPELARKAFGDYSFLISGGIAGMQFGVCLTYLIFVPQNIYELIRDIFGIVVPKSLILVAMLVIEIPLCWIRDIRKLTPINILATLFIAFGLTSILYIALFNKDENNNSIDKDGNHMDLNLIQEISDLPLIKDTWALFIGTSFFCFEGSITLLIPLQEAVYNQKDRAKFPSVNQNVVSATVAFYMLFGIVCWASFGDSVSTALTTSLPKGALSTIVQLVYSIAVIFTFPLQAFPALEVVCNTTRTKTGRNQRSEDAIIFKRNLIATFIICLLGFIAVISTNYLGNVVSLLGSLVGIPIALIYPPLMHNRIVTDSSRMTQFANICLSLVGVFAATAASYTTIAQWNDGEEG